MKEYFSNVKMLCTIVPRGKGETVVEVLEWQGVKLNLILMGKGTAPKAWSDLLGLGGNKKDIVISIINGDETTDLMAILDYKMNLSQNGKGVVISVGINGMSSKKLLEYCTVGVEE